MFNLNLTAMKRTSLIFATSLMLMATISLTSCQKDEETDPIVSTMQQDDEATAYYDDVLTEVDELTMKSDDAKSMDYAVLNTEGQGTRTRKTSWDGDWRVDTITYSNFVNGNARFEKVKNGQIVIRTLGNPLAESFERNVTFVNFTINGNLIEGEKNITKTANYTYTITLQDGKITFTDGTTYTRTFTRTRTWVAGFDTPYYIWDDIHTVEGTATGINRNGYAYTHQITNALMIKLSCRWIVEGTIELTVGDKSATFDYGNGECDNIATVTVNGKTYEVKLRGGK